MRLRPTVNWILLSLNGLLLVLLLVISIVYGRILTIDVAAMRAAARGAAAFEELGIPQDIYCAKGPFALLVAKTFPRDPSFYFYQQDIRLALSVDDGMVAKNDGMTHSTILTLGDTFSFSVTFSPAGRLPKIGSLSLYQKKGDVFEGLTDDNADGVFDSRVTADEQETVRAMYVWYHGAWCAVAPRSPEDFPQTKYRKQLLDGERVYFDFQSGEWLPLTQDSAAPAARAEP